MTEVSKSIQRSIKAPDLSELLATTQRNISPSFSSNREKFLKGFGQNQQTNANINQSQQQDKVELPIKQTSTNTQRRLKSEDSSVDNTCKAKLCPKTEFSLVLTEKNCQENTSEVRQHQNQMANQSFGCVKIQEDATSVKKLILQTISEQIYMIKQQVQQEQIAKINACQQEFTSQWNKINEIKTQIAQEREYQQFANTQTTLETQERLPTDSKLQEMIENAVNEQLKGLAQENQNCLLQLRDIKAQIVQELQSKIIQSNIEVQAKSQQHDLMRQAISDASAQIEKKININFSALNDNQKRIDEFAKSYQKQLEIYLSQKGDQINDFIQKVNSTIQDNQAGLTQRIQAKVGAADAQAIAAQLVRAAQASLTLEVQQAKAELKRGAEDLLTIQQSLLSKIQHIDEILKQNLSTILNDQKKHKESNQQQIQQLQQKIENLEKNCGQKQSMLTDFQNKVNIILKYNFQELHSPSASKKKLQQQQQQQAFSPEERRITELSEIIAKLSDKLQVLVNKATENTQKYQQKLGNLQSENESLKKEKESLFQILQQQGQELLNKSIMQTQQQESNKGTEEVGQQILLASQQQSKLLARSKKNRIFSEYTSAPPPKQISQEVELLFNDTTLHQLNKKQEELELAIPNPQYETELVAQKHERKISNQLTNHIAVPKIICSESTSTQQQAVVYHDQGKNLVLQQQQQLNNLQIESLKQQDTIRDKLYSIPEITTSSPFEPQTAIQQFTGLDNLSPIYPNSGTQNASKQELKYLEDVKQVLLSKMQQYQNQQLVSSNIVQEESHANQWTQQELVKNQSSPQVQDQQIVNLFTSVDSIQSQVNLCEQNYFERAVDQNNYEQTPMSSQISSQQCAINKQLIQIYNNELADQNKQGNITPSKMYISPTTLPKECVNPSQLGTIHNVSNQKSQRNTHSNLSNNNYQNLNINDFEDYQDQASEHNDSSSSDSQSDIFFYPAASNIHCQGGENKLSQHQITSENDQKIPTTPLGKQQLEIICSNQQRQLLSPLQVVVADKQQQNNVQQQNNADYQYNSKSNNYSSNQSLGSKSPLSVKSRFKENCPKSPLSSLIELSKDDDDNADVQISQKSRNGSYFTQPNQESSSLEKVRAIQRRTLYNQTIQQNCGNNAISSKHEPLKCFSDQQGRLRDEFDKYIFDKSGTPIIYSLEELNDLVEKRIIQVQQSE